MTRKKLQRYLQELRYIIPTLYFNFHYLPFRQAIKLPIILYKPHLLKCKGIIKIEPEDGRIRHGMIQMGARIVSVYPDNGITWENHGGTVVFRGNCRFGGDSYISVGPLGKLDIGHHFAATAGMKLVCYHNTTFQRYVGFGWGSLCTDTNFHPLYDIEKKEFLSECGPIEIGKHNWFGIGCKVMHNVTTPEHCTWGMGTTVTRGCVKKAYCVMGGSPVHILRENVKNIMWYDSERIIPQLSAK